MTKISDSLSKNSNFSFYAKLGWNFQSKIKFSLSFNALLITLWKLQMIFLTIHTSIHFLEDQTFALTLFMKKFSGIFILGELLEYTTYNPYSSGFFLIIQSYTLYTFLHFIIILLSTVLSIELPSRVTSYFGILNQVNLYIISFPFICVNMRFIKHWSDSDLVLFSNVQNLGTFGVLSVISLTWLIIFTNLPLLLFNVPIKTKNQLQTKDNTTLKIELLFKEILISIFIFSQDNNSKILALCFINLIETIFRFYLSLNRFPYFQIKWMRVDFIFTCIGAMICCITIIGSLFHIPYPSFPNKFLIFALSIYIPFGIAISNKVFNRTLQNIINNPKNLNKFMALHYLEILKEMLNSRIPIQERTHSYDFNVLYFEGKKFNIPIIDASSGIKQNFIVDDKKILNSFINHYWTYTSKKFAGFFPLKIMFFNSVLKNKTNFLEASNLIEEYKKRNNSIVSEICIMIAAENLEIALNKKSKLIDLNSKLNLRRYIRLNEWSDELKIKIDEQADLQTKFWNFYILNEPNFKELYDLSRKIEKKKAVIKTFWKNLDNYNNKSFTNPYLNYALYLDIINNQPTESVNFLKTGLINKRYIGSNLNEINDETIFQSGSYQLITSGKKENLGKILSCSPTFLQKFGYLSNELINCNFSVLLPSFYRENHDIWIRKSVSSGKQKCQGRSREVIIQDKDKYIIPMLFHSQQSPFIENGITFISVLRQFSDNQEILLLKNNGLIAGMSKNISKYLGFKPDEFSFISDYCSGFNNILSIFNKYAEEEILKHENIEYVFTDFVSYQKKDSHNSSIVLSDKLAPTERNLLIDNPLTTDRFNTSRGLSDLKSPSKIFEKKSLQFIKTQNSAMNKSLVKFDLDPNRKDKEVDFLDSEKIYDEFKNNFSQIIFLNKEKQNIKMRMKIHIDYCDDNWIFILKIKDIDIVEIQEEQMEETDFDRNNNTLKFGMSQIAVQGSMALNLTEAKLGTLMNESKITTQRYSISIKDADHEVSIDNDSSKGYASIPEEEHKDKKSYKFFEYDDSKNESQNDVEKGLKKEASQDLDLISRNMSKNVILENVVSISKRSDSQTSPVEEEEVKAQDILAERHKTKQMVKGDAGSSIGTSTSNFRRVDKMYQNAIDFRYFPFKYILFMIVYILLIIAMEGLIIGVGSFITASLDEIQSKGDIVITAYKRTDSLDLSIVSSRFINQAILGRVSNTSYGVSLIPDFLKILGKYLPMLDENNKKLEQSVRTIEPNLQDEFYKTKTVFFDVDQSGILNSSQQFDTFQGVSKIFSLASKILSNPYLNSTARNIDVNYIRQNSLGNILVSSETSIKLTNDELSNVIASYQNQLDILAGIGLGVLGSLLVYIILIGNEMNKGVFHFCKYFQKISNDEVLNLIAVIDSFKDKLKKDFQDGYINTNTEVKKRSNSHTRSANHKRNASCQKEFKFKSIILRNFVQVLKLWPAIIALILTIIIIYIHSSSATKNLKNLQNQLVVIASAQYTLNLGACATIDIVVRNASSTIRSQPILNEMNKIIELGKNSNSFLSSFTDSDGKINPDQSELLLGVDCFNSAIIDQAHSSLCEKLSGGRNKLGLLEANVNLVNSIQQVINDFLSSARNSQTIYTFLPRIWTETMQINRLQDDIISQLGSVTNKAFFDFLSEEKIYIITLVVIASIIIIILAILCISKVLVQVVRSDNKVKEIMKLLPLQMIMRNRWLKSYIVETSGKLGYSINKS